MPEPPDHPPGDTQPETLELHEIRTCEDGDEHAPQSTATVSSGENRVVPIRTLTRTVSRRRSENGSSQDVPKGRLHGIWISTRRFWTGHVVLKVPQKSNRDHYAVERTFLAYIRTSVVLSMLGVLIAQLFRLQRSIPQEQNYLTYYEVAIPLSVTCHCAALVIVGIGAFRFWRQQSAIVSGKIHAGGWELNSVGFLIAAIVITTLVLSVVVTVELH